MNRRPTYAEIARSSLAVIYSDTVYDALRTNCQALSGLTLLVSCGGEMPNPEEMGALLRLILTEQEQLLSQGVSRQDDQQTAVVPPAAG